jgi:hypothetical protein
MRVYVLIIGLLGLGLASIGINSALSDDVSSQGTAEETAHLRVLPLVEIPSPKGQVIKVEFANISNQPIRYLLYDDLRPNYLPIAFLEFSLYKDGQLVPVLETPEGPRAYPRLVRELPPNESIVSELDLKETYGELPAGRYILRVSYLIDGENLAKDLGLTLIQFDKPLLSIDIE